MENGFVLNDLTVGVVLYRDKIYFLQRIIIHIFVFIVPKQHITLICMNQGISVKFQDWKK